jgi:hypothetical protein
MIDRKFPWPAACLVLLALSFVSVSSAIAQRSDGTISGIVKDPSGAVVPGAAVMVTGVQTGAVRTTITSDVGTYTVPNLLVGAYTVKIDVAGFAPYTRNNVQVQAAQVVEVSADLVIQANVQTIQVQAGADLVQVQSSQLSRSFDNKLVSELPTISGQNTSVLNLAIFLPNTTTALGGTSGTGGSIGGLRGRQNSFSVDGVNNNDPSVTTVSQQVIPDAVQEFSLSTNQFSAEFGTAAGGQFNVVTKRGTNEIHGGAWLYNINRNYLATSNLADSSNPNPRYDYNRLGGSLGGPILRNRWFAFGAFEYQTQGREALGATATLPTANGLQTMTNLAVNDAVRSILAQFPSAPTQSGSLPVTVGSTTTQIPIGQVSLNAPDYVTQYDYLINSDLNLTRHSVRGGYLYTRRRLPQSPPVPQTQFFGFSANDNKKVTLSDIWVLNNTTVNEFRASYSRFISAALLEGIASTYPNVEITGGLGVQIGAPSNFPQGRTMNQYQLVEQFNRIRGRHSFKAGAEVRWYTGVSDFLQNSRGIYYYSNIANLLMDQVPANDQLQGIGSGVVSLNARNLAMFVQDDIKLLKRLTVNVGVRYEYYGNPAGAANQERNSVSDLPGTPLVFHTPKTDKNNFAPRLGFAWDMLGNGKWALRGGFGMAYDVAPFNFHMNGQPPQQQTILRAAAACAGRFSTAPSWCASYLADGLGSNFLAGAAMKLTYRPPTDQSTARSMTNQLMVDARFPKVFNWSLGLQHELVKDTTIEVRYLGTRALFLPVQIQLNSQTALERGASTLPTYFSASQVPATMPASAPTLAQFLAARGRPYAAQGFPNAITSMQPIGVSEYHGGAVDLHRRFSQGLLFRANYTWAKGMDNGTNDLFTSVVNPRRPQDPNNLDAEWSRSTLDIRHKAALMWTYDIPRARVDARPLKALLHGWQWNGTYLFQSGQPITIQSGVDSNGNLDSAGDRVILNPNGTGRTGTSVNFVCRNASGSTSIATSAAACGGNGSVAGYVAANPIALYVQAGAGAIANVGRNTVDSEHLNLWNMSMFKNFAITEGKKLQFRFEMFNAFNVGQYALGNADVAPVQLSTNAQSASYANVTAANFLNSRQFDRRGRSFQLGLKFNF